jgi:hypothetical protein
MLVRRAHCLETIDRRQQAEIDSWVNRNVHRIQLEGTYFWGDPQWDGFKKKATRRGHRYSSDSKRLT